MLDHGPAGDFAEIIAALDRIAIYTLGMDEDAFVSNLLVLDAVGMNLIVIGEAARRIAPDVLAAEDGVPWREIVGLRNRIAHGYEDIQPEVIWAIIRRDLADLRLAVERLQACAP